MGLVGSKGLLEASCSQASTPTSCKGQFFGIDPRSPSEEFARTPIAFMDDSFDSLSQFSEDPRSPAIGFQRTPIPAQPSNDLSLIQDPRSPTCEVPRTPLEKIAYSYDEDIETEEEEEEEEIIADVQMSPFKIRNQQTSTPNFKIPEDLPESPAQYKLAKLNLRNDQDQHFDSPRSPLAISNRPNSLRIRVQHKMHASKIAAGLNGGAIITNKPVRLMTDSSVDKENSPVY